MRNLSRFVVALAVLALVGAAPVAAVPPSAGEILTDLGFNLGEQVALEEGEIISRDLPRTRDNELTAIAAVLVPAPLERVEAVVLDEQARENGITFVNVPIDAADWQSAQFAEAERAELARLAEAAPGSDLNLSGEEIAVLRAEAGKDAAGAYKAILIDRVRDYANRGLDGVAPYARVRGPASSPAAELRFATQQIQGFLGKHFPHFAEALASYPNQEANGIENRFSWSKDMVDGRPAFVLTHDMVDCSNEHCVVNHRQFFVGHTYNSLQTVRILVPTREGTLVIVLNRTFTDRVAGPFSGFEKQVGQEMMRKSLIADFADLRDRALAPVQQAAD